MGEGIRKAGRVRRQLSFTWKEGNHAIWQAAYQRWARAQPQGNGSAQDYVMHLIRMSELSAGNDSRSALSALLARCAAGARDLAAAFGSGKSRPCALEENLSQDTGAGHDATAPGDEAERVALMVRDMEIRMGSLRDEVMAMGERIAAIADMVQTSGRSHPEAGGSARQF